MNKCKICGSISNLHFHIRLGKKIVYNYCKPCYSKLLEKRQSFRKGKTYEELYGEEKSNHIKNKQRIIGKINKIKYKDKISAALKYSLNKPGVQKRRLNTLNNNYIKNPKKLEKVRKIRAQVCKNNFKGKEPSIKGKKQSEKIKEKIAIGVAKHTAANGWGVGKHEKVLLDKFEKKYNIKIKRHIRIGRYIVDGYCERLNIVFEVDEKFHTEPNQIIKDKIRQKNIENMLQCMFIRIKDY